MLTYSINSAPEQYDVIDAIVLPVQRKNLAEIAKMLQQISSGKVFDDNDLFLAPLNDFVLESAQVFSDWFMECKFLMFTRSFCIFTDKLQSNKCGGARDILRYA